MYWLPMFKKVNMTMKKTKIIKLTYKFIKILHLSICHQPASGLSLVRAFISSSIQFICDLTLRIAVLTYFTSSFFIKRGTQSSLISNSINVKMSWFKSNILAQTFTISSLLFLFILSSDVTISRYLRRVLFKINPWQMIALFTIFSISFRFL